MVSIGCCYFVFMYAYCLVSLIRCCYQLWIFFCSFSAFCDGKFPGLYSFWWPDCSLCHIRVYQGFFADFIPVIGQIANNKLNISFYLDPGQKFTIACLTFWCFVIGMNGLRIRSFLVIFSNSWYINTYWNLVVYVSFIT